MKYKIKIRIYIPHIFLDAKQITNSSNKTSILHRKPLPAAPVTKTLTGSVVTIVTSDEDWKCNNRNSRS